MLRSRRQNAQGGPAANQQQQAPQPVSRAGAGGYNYRLHPDGRVEIVRPGGSIFVTKESNASAYDAIIAEVGAYPEQAAPAQAAPEQQGPDSYLDDVQAQAPDIEAPAAAAVDMSPVTRVGGGGYTYRLHADGRVEIVRNSRSIFVTATSNATAYNAIINEVGTHPALGAAAATTVETPVESTAEQSGPVLQEDMAELTQDDAVQAAAPEQQKVESRDVHGMDRSQLQTILASPETYGMGMWAAAHARDRMLEHQEQFDATGTGTIEGLQTGEKTEGAEGEDCTTYILETLSAAFNAVGKGALWKATMREAQKNSPDGLLGTEVMKALESQAGWKSIFWAPDGKNPGDGSNEHSYTAAMAKKKGDYYGLDVDKDNTVTNYRPSTTQMKGDEEVAVANPVEKDTSGLDKLKQVPVAVLAARGGKHMGLMINGAVYEVHWDYTAQNRDTLEATPLEQWGWMSGAVTAPGADIDQAFGNE